MRTFHHVGIPTTKQRPSEILLEGAKLFITDAEKSPYRVEWLRFQPGSPLPAALQANPHVAFMVDDLAAEMKGKKVVLEPFVPLEGLIVGFIEEDGAFIELMQKTA